MKPKKKTELKVVQPGENLRRAKAELANQMLNALGIRTEDVARDFRLDEGEELQLRLDSNYLFGCITAFGQGRQ